MHGGKFKRHKKLALLNKNVIVPPHHAGIHPPLGSFDASLGVDKTHYYIAYYREARFIKHIALPGMYDPAMQ